LIDLARYIIFIRGWQRVAFSGDALTQYLSFVPSAALLKWQSERANRIAELFGAHAAIGHGRAGALQINWSLTLRLAGEFQAYARDLHELAVDHLVAEIAPPGTRLAELLSSSLTKGRELDRGNAQPRSLASDFGRLGLRLWPSLLLKDPQTERLKESLQALNRARNAIAHAEDDRLAALADEGYPMRLATVRRWHSDLGRLARSMDVVVAESLAPLTEKPAPW
jgi:hypothetical protein